MHTLLLFDYLRHAHTTERRLLCNKLQKCTLCFTSHSQHFASSRFVISAYLLHLLCRNFLLWHMKIHNAVLTLVDCIFLALFLFVSLHFQVLLYDYVFLLKARQNEKKREKIFFFFHLFHTVYFICFFSLYFTLCLRAATQFFVFIHSLITHCCCYCYFCL